MSKKSTEEILNAFAHCKYKAFLYTRGEAVGVKSEYQLLQEELDLIYIETFKQRCLDEKNDLRTISFDENGDKYSVLGFYNVKKSKAFFSPVVFNRSAKITKEIRLYLALQSTVASNRGLPIQIDQGIIVNGPNFKQTKMTIVAMKKSTAKPLGDLNTLTGGTEPKFQLNRHCKICEFQKLCRDEAIKKDELSLLSLKEKEIVNLNKRGLFTITQLSHTFRPKRRLKNLDIKKRPRQIALHALAIREKKIHIFSPKELSLNSTHIFLDVESDPEQDFYYLIGVVIKQSEGSKRISFWADEKSDEIKIFKEFLTVCESISEFSLIHYGSYEAKFLKTMGRRSGMEDSPIIQKLLERSINLLEIVYTSIYFPTYSNDLKSIAGSIGFKWTHEEASGLQSIVWRARWENSKEQTIKEKLLVYNIEDCLALEVLVDVINSVLNYKKVTASAGDINIVRAEDVNNRPKGNNWRSVKFELPEMDTINKCAYFDYQRDRVFIRTQRKEAARRRYKKKPSSLNKLNKIHEVPISACPHCGLDGKVTRQKRTSRTIYDLNFFKGGIKKWAVKYTTNLCLCSICKGSFYPSQYPGEENKYGSRFGHGLMSWVVYQYVVNGSSLAKIQNDLREFFRLEVGQTTLNRFKIRAEKYYMPTYQKILSKILSSNMIAADETQLLIRNQIIYIWVFATSTEAIYIYRETRESSFLDDFLKDFKGVLVTDFFSGYDSQPCPQQKCLIHLMRDFNDDIKENPFDEEFKEMTRAFTLLLRSIIETVDRRGLKKRFLAKHKKDVSRFFEKFIERDYMSDPAKKYQKRFRKNKDKLFTFLDYDGVPWNSNAAEHAIKHLARVRQKGIANKFKTEWINSYLQALSIYQTCLYRKISYLAFLLSKEKELP